MAEPFALLELVMFCRRLNRMSRCILRPLLGLCLFVFSVVSSAKESSGPRLEEVIVTAQKRAENIRDVPISISVMSGEEMVNAGIMGLNDMVKYMSNISLNDSSSSLYVRGIGTPELNAVGEQAVAFIIDGLYIPKLNYLRSGYMDMERIEVLKGPQGTLYGRNATGGVINISNAKPTMDWHASLRVTEGNNDIRDYEAAISGPVLNDLSFRLAAKEKSETGTTYSLGDGESIGDREQELARLSLRYDLGDIGDISLSVTDTYWFIGSFIATEFHYYPEGQRTGFPSLDPNFEAVLDRRTSAPRNKGSEYENRLEGDSLVVPLEVNVDIHDFTLTSITGYTELSDFAGGDIDGLSADIVGLKYLQDDKQYSQELRLSSPPGPLEYILGAYYLTGNFNVYTELPIYGDFLAIAGVGPEALGIDPNLLVNLPPQQAESAVLDNLIGQLDIDLESTGLFGQLTWHLNESLTMILGARSSTDKKDGIIQTDTTGPVPIWPQLTDAPYTYESKIHDKDTSGKFSISWDIIEEITAYFTFAQGFRAGSFNGGATRANAATFKAESSDTFELGLKTEFLGGAMRWNFGLFRTDYRDYQLSSFTGVGYVTRNAPKVLTQGFETDLTALLSENLLINATFGFNDATYTDHPDAACPTPPQGESDDPFASPADAPEGCDLTGRQLHRAPRRNASIRMEYSFSITDGIAASVGLDATFKDDEYFDGDLDPLDFQEGYWLSNAKIGIRDKDERWRLDIYGKNLEDKLVKVHSGDAVLQAGAHTAGTNNPRYYFATLTFNY